MTLSIHNAARNNQLSLVRALVEENEAQINVKDADGRAPLHCAAASDIDTIDVITYLLEHKADVNATDPSGWAPLHCAASAGRENIVKELLGAGANVNAKTSQGMTPLHYAASKQHIDIGRLLIERGADNNARNNANQLSLHRAATTGSTGFLKLLLNPPEGSAKPRLNTGDRVGNTPLHLAMESAHAEAAVLLIEAGADRERTNVDGETPEQLEGVGGPEQRRAREYVRDRCGPPPS
ncbi:26s proteasome non-atpase regulatory subunit 10 [Pyrrhoderma noxium]|uniref:26s proteasome non-atpase regulatory subunit 10 n=1 Tax=Pyrrhoderma noxium TaxID=2282107 RepID=A0A286U953_9AGAM|nr:26s proteasome non-atpase regulatory subunit 10 [Pyrrhoderma noxium]